VITGFDLTPLLKKRVDAKLGYATNEGLILKGMHVPIKVFVAADNGFPLPDYCFFTTDKGFTKDRSEIKGFLKAAAAGWQAARADPGAAASAVIALQAGAKRAETVKEISLDTRNFIMGPNAPGPLFAVAPPSIDTVSALLLKVGFIKKPVPASDIYDGSLVPAK